MKCLPYASLLLLLWSCISVDRSERLNSQLNIVIILTDDQGWGDLSVTGNQDLQTPNIDRMARQGARLNRFYVSPVCSPTRAELLTGRYHPRGGVYGTSSGGERLDLDETTIAEVFQQNGYKTAAFGKWHNGQQHPYHPNARGFEEFYGFCSGHLGNYFDPVLEHNGEIVQGKGFVIDDLTNQALQFLESNKNQPFFLYLPYNTPHSPMQVPDQWWDKFKGKNLKTPFSHPKADIPHTRAAYAMCENIDWNVGRIMNKLEELALMDNTIIIYFSDNGPNGYRWNGGLKGKKAHLDEGGVRSPGFIQWKDMIEADLQVDKPTAAIDLLPTLADLAGIPWKPGRPLDGVSLKPLLLQTVDTWPDRYIFSHWRGKTSLRDQRFMLDKDGRLFDLIKDPGQRIDLSKDHPEVLHKMMDSKAEWEREVLSALNTNERRPFPVGHPDATITPLPARDGIPHGGIQRSNLYPNSSFFTHWTSTSDSITWDIEVLEEGDYAVGVYYTCTKENTGSTLELSFQGQSLQTRITQAHDSPPIGKADDRVVRPGSYEKDFKLMSLGTIKLRKDTGPMTLKALDVAAGEVMDFRLMLLTKTTDNPKVE